MCRMRVKAFVLTLSLTRPIRECTLNVKMPQKMPKIEVEFTLANGVDIIKMLDIHL